MINSRLRFSKKFYARRGFATMCFFSITRTLFGIVKLYKSNPKVSYTRIAELSIDWELDTYGTIQTGHIREFPAVEEIEKQWHSRRTPCP